jgi:hypothetical protein
MPERCYFAYGTVITAVQCQTLMDILHPVQKVIAGEIHDYSYKNGSFMISPSSDNYGEHYLIHDADYLTLADGDWGTSISTPDLLTLIAKIMKVGVVEDFCKQYKYDAPKWQLFIPYDA